MGHHHSSLQKKTRDNRKELKRLTATQTSVEAATKNTKKTKKRKFREKKNIKTSDSSSLSQKAQGNEIDLDNQERSKTQRIENSKDFNRFEFEVSSTEIPKDLSKQFSENLDKQVDQNFKNSSCTAIILRDTSIPGFYPDSHSLSEYETQNSLIPLSFDITEPRSFNRWFLEDDASVSSMESTNYESENENELMPTVFSTKRAERKRRSNRKKGRSSNPSTPSQELAKRNASDSHSPKLHRGSPESVLDNIRVPRSVLRGVNNSIRNSRKRMSKKSRQFSGAERSVSRLRPSKALVQKDKQTVTEAVTLMVDRRSEATLLIGEDGMLSGILTDKDIAFRVVAKGLDPNSTLVSEVMTPDPSCVSPMTSALVALREMVSGQFRHLPVADNGKIIGLLDITKCLYDAISKIERAYDASSTKFLSAVEKLEQDIGGMGGAKTLFDAMREKLFLPTLSTLVNDDEVVPEVSSNSTAKQAAEMMLDQGCSAVMVFDMDTGDAIGIFTSKDLMRRTVAAGMDPNACLVKDIMTPNPDYATCDTSILDALHLMHDGRFLHLPVLGPEGCVVGLIDVLQVTYGVVNQMGSLQQASEDSITPVWGNFWSSMLQDDSSTVSLTSGDVHGDMHEHNSNRESYPDVFTYTLKDSEGNKHRFSSSADNVELLLGDVQTRLNDFSFSQLNYVDDEKENVLLLKNDDLKDAVVAARASAKTSIRLIVPRNNTEKAADIKSDRSEWGISISQDTVRYAIAATAVALAGVTYSLARRN